MDPFDALQSSWPDLHFHRRCHHGIFRGFLGSRNWPGSRSPRLCAKTEAVEQKVETQ